MCMRACTYIHTYTHTCAHIQSDGTIKAKSKALGIRMSAPARNSISTTIDLTDARFEYIQVCFTPHTYAYVRMYAFISAPAPNSTREWMHMDLSVIPSDLLCFWALLYYRFGKGMICIYIYIYKHTYMHMDLSAIQSDAHVLTRTYIHTYWGGKHA
jgi:hypothetical protein